MPDAIELLLKSTYDPAGTAAARADFGTLEADIRNRPIRTGEVFVPPEAMAAARTRFDAELEKWSDKQTEIRLDAQPALDRIRDIDAALGNLARKAEAGTITVGEVGQARALESEFKSLQSAISGAKTETGGLGGALGALDAIIPGIGGKLVTAFSVVGIVAFAAEVGKTVLALNAMREQSAQIEARFIAFGGGAAKATEAFAAMDAAVGGALTRDEKMAAVARITTLELTKSAEETAQLAKQALVLGAAGQSAASKIESLTQILVTGRTMGLAQYGISTQAVNERVKELQAETSTLSDLEAKQIAIREALASKTEAVIASGGKAAVATQELTNAWEDLKDAAADTVNLDVVVNILTKITRGAAGVMGDTDKESLLSKIFNPGRNEEVYQQQQQLANLSTQYAKLQQTMAAIQATGGGITPAMTAEAQRLAAGIAEVQNELRMLANPAQDAERDFIAMMAALAAGAKPAEDGLAGVKEALKRLREGKTATDENTVAMAIFTGQLTEAQVAAWGLVGALAYLGNQSATPDMGAYWNQASGNQPTMTLEGLRSWEKSAAQVQTDRIKAVGDATEQARLDGIKAANDLKTANEAAAKATQAAWQKAFDGLASAATSAVDKSKDRLLDLLPNLKTGADWATDPNGPFRDVGRAADVAAHGTASPWAQQIAGQLKTDMDHVQAAAKTYTEGYVKNPYSAASMALVDQASIVDNVIADANMKADMEALGDKWAALALASPKLKAAGSAITMAVVGGMGGGGAKPTGKDSAGTQTTSYDAAAKAMLDGYAGAAQVQVSDATFGKDMGKIGTQTFVLFERGVVDAAKESQGLKAAIFAMVAAAIASQRTSNSMGMNGP